MNSFKQGCRIILVVGCLVLLSGSAYAGFSEGYFYTHGPVIVFATDTTSVVTIRNPSTGALVDSGSIDIGNMFYETSIPAGFYYISVSQAPNAMVLAGVSSSAKCNGYYHYMSSGKSYGDRAEISEWYLRATNGCDNQLYIFPTSGASSGYTCSETICLEGPKEEFDFENTMDYYVYNPSDLYGYLIVQSGQPVFILARDDAGYFVPPYENLTSARSTFKTYLGANEYLNIHSFVDGAQVNILSMQVDPPQSIWNGTLNEGETHTIEGPAFTLTQRVMQISGPVGGIAVSVLGGNGVANTDYMTYALDPGGNMQGTDFITRNPGGGSLYIFGLDDDTTVELRNAETNALVDVHTIETRGEHWTKLPGDGIWRVRADKDITLCVRKGKGGTCVPLTENTSGSTPYPPIIAGVRWTPLHPNSDQTHVTVRWLTDELTTGKLHYFKSSTSTWSEKEQNDLAYEHEVDIDAWSQDHTEFRMWVEATDQSGQTSSDNNNGDFYRFEYRSIHPEIDVRISEVLDEGDYYRIKFAIENSGLEAARHVKVGMRLIGMQPFGDEVKCGYDRINFNEVHAVLDVGYLYENYLSFRYVDVRPFLGDSAAAISYMVLDCTSYYEDHNGWGRSENYPVLQYGWDSDEIESRMEDKFYVILFNAERFFDVYDHTRNSSQRMMRAMTRFANHREAVMVYTKQSTPNSIRSQIQGRFNGKINEAWLDGGYLALVGDSSIIPSFSWHLECNTDESDIGVCDVAYANIDNDGKFKPELCLGRFTGNSANTYAALFERSMTVPYYNKSFCVAGTGGGQGVFEDNALSAHNRLRSRHADNVLEYLGDYEEDDRLGVYIEHTNDVDFLYYRNHGGNRSWGTLTSNNVDHLCFAGKYPIVYGNACLSGNIQDSNNLAEAFLDQYASVYIGATVVSPRYENNEMGRQITGRYRDGDTIGKAFRDAKRSMSGDIKDSQVCTKQLRQLNMLLMYNLYGDPMRGRHANYYDKAITQPDDPTPALDLTVPMYIVETGRDGFDHVSIPDEEHGGYFTELYEPIVPSYRWTASYAPGIRLTNITMTSRTGESHQSGLNLPTSWGPETETPGPEDVPSPGDFPTEDFYLDRIERADGGMDVQLSVYPFIYNAQTQDATFYQNYSFELEFVQSSVSIDRVGLKFDPMPLDYNQFINVEMSKSGSGSETVDLTVEISDFGGDVLSELSSNSIVISSATPVTGTVIWPTSGVDPRMCLVTARVNDSDTGDEYDIGYTQFRLGNPKIGILSFVFDTETPGRLKVPESVPFEFEIKSAGDSPVSGTSYLELRRESDGVCIEHWEKGFTDLAKDATHEQSGTWNSEGMEPGTYQLLGWVEHEGGVTDFQSIQVRTLEKMSFNWEAPKDVYGRGDKIMMTGDICRMDGTVIGPADNAEIGYAFITGTPNFAPTLNEHTYSPHYSTSFMVTAENPTGPYGLVATAEKEGHKNALGGRWFMVTDNPFGMTASAPVCVADGVTSVEVTTDIITIDGSPIADGTLMTVVSWGGTIDEPDASGAAYKQLQSSGGRYQFTWLSPTNTWREAYVAGLLGDVGSDYPMSGLSMIFKSIDFNDNRRVDISDILKVSSLADSIFGAPDYDLQMDLNEDDSIDTDDINLVADRWGLEFADAVHCSTCTPESDSLGLILRPHPARATIAPGQQLTISIIAEGLDDLGGYEFGCILTDDALDWESKPKVTKALENQGYEQTALGPDSYDTGYRLGAYAIGDGTSVNGTVTIATLTVSADQLGESTLILSAPLFARTDGSRMPILRVNQGVYEVANPTNTPTVTPTLTPTMTLVATGTPTATPTETSPPTVTATNTATPVPPSPTPTSTPVLGDTNGDGEINMNDCFHFSIQWQKDAEAADARCNPATEEVNDRVNERDLLILIREWER